MVRQNHIVPQTRAQRMSHPFRHPAGVDEDESSAFGNDVPGQTIINLFPHLAGGDGSEFVVRNLDSKSHGAPVTDIDQAGAR